ncbi:unannotated protein [freshwater metagenome]|uniref:Unannotated protein n=1 Tax=freshwater metagenome TaxID=449393 RepID=A0A6J6T9C0_9ZZZZ
MGADLGAEAVLEGRDDAAAIRVVLRVRAGDHEQVERQSQRVAAHLDIALLEHVEQGHLDALGEIGQLVHGEDAAVRARHEAEVDGLRVAERAPLGHLHRVDVADEIADGRVWGRELLAVALAAVTPGNGQAVAELAGKASAARAYRHRRVVIDLAPGHHRRPLVEKIHEGADEAGLALAALAEEHDVVAGEQCPFDLRAHRLIEADDAREGVVAIGEALDEVRANLILDRAMGVAGGAKGAEGHRKVGRGLIGRTAGRDGRHTRTVAAKRAGGTGC